MGIVKRQSIKASAINYVGMLIGVLNIIFLFPKLLSPEKLGVINLIQFFGLLYMMIPLLGSNSLLVTYFSKYESETDRKKLYTFTTLSMLLGLVAFSVLFYFTKNFIELKYLNTIATESFKPYYTLVLPIVWATTIYAYLEAYCIAKLRISVSAFIKEIGIRLMMLLLIFLFYKNVISYEELIYYFIAIYILATLVLLSYAIGKGYRINTNIKKSLSIITQEHLEYMFYLYVSTVSLAIISFFGNVWLGIVAGEARVAIFAIGLYIATMIQIPYRAFSQIITPLIAEAWGKNDIEKIKAMNKQSGLNLVLVGTFLFALLCINIDNIMYLFANYPRYQPYIGKLKMIILLIGAGKLFDMFTGLNTEIIATSKYFKFTLVSVIVMAVITFVTNIYFIPKLGIVGAAISFLIVQIVYNATKFLFLYKQFHMSPFSIHGVWIMLIGILLGALCYFLPLHLQPILDGMVRSSLFVIGFMAVILHYKLAPDIHEYWQKIKAGQLFTLHK